MQELQEIVKLIEEKKAFDITILDISKLSIVTDYFIICSASSTQMVKAIIDNVEEKSTIKILRIEGKTTYRWVVVDFGNIILHVFHQNEREFYNLERLWIDAPKVNI
ncbi:ribosome silencing factor [Caldicellulosiruptoraceae bacterium PP1]